MLHGRLVKMPSSLTTIFQIILVLFVVTLALTLLHEFLQSRLSDEDDFLYDDEEIEGEIIINQAEATQVEDNCRCPEGVDCINCAPLTYGTDA